MANINKNNTFYIFLLLENNTFHYFPSFHTFHIHSLKHVISQEFNLVNLQIVSITSQYRTNTIHELLKKPLPHNICTLTHLLSFLSCRTKMQRMRGIYIYIYISYTINYEFSQKFRVISPCVIDICQSSLR